MYCSKISQIPTDFGIFIQLSPDEEEKQMLENNIQVAVQAGLIDLSDAIDLREIKKDKEFSKTREEILTMIWNMEEEIMGRDD